ncbi:hypothetical protein WJX73_008222 [Symbiochloris irregularis]|uniref:Amino acid transporter n=1 Tax=Symbiochloris irregularis TaxID=706552 RepID=A0AAW1P9C4_9CHLO
MPQRYEQHERYPSMSDTRQEYRLRRLGLKQEFKRDFDFLASFGLSFTIGSPLVGISVGLSYAWTVGGPAAAIWGWPIGSVGLFIIGLSMAEIVSGLPSSGGPYFWSSWLAGRHGPILSYITGWLNLYGQLGLASGNAGSATSCLVAIVSLMTGATLSNAHMLLMQIGILVLSGAINTCPPKMVARFLALGIFVNFAGVIFLVLLLPAVAPFWQGPKFVFGTLYDRSQSPINAPSNAYLWCQGPTIALFCIAGFDCCSHISEETKGADSSTPLAILWSIAAAGVVGYVMLLGMLFCVQDPDPASLLDPDAALGGYVAGQLVWDCFAARYGTGRMSVSVLGLFALSAVMCTVATLTSNSRCLFSFSRSKGVPFSGFCNRLTGIMLRCIGRIPILCRLTISRTSFEPGPFHLGSFSAAVGWTAIAWILTASVLMCLPTAVPMPLDNSPIWLAIVLGGSLTAWFLPRFGVKKRYLDPRQQAAAAAITPSNLIRLGTI